MSNQTYTNDILGVDDGTFTAMQDKISSASEGSTITLENDCPYDEGFNKNGLLSKPITIDAKGQSLISNIESDTNIINPTSTSMDMDVDKLETNISAVYNVETKELVATLVNVGESKIIKGATVAVNIAGIEHNGQTDSKGQLKVPITNLAPGRYVVVSSYKGNSKYNPTSTSLDIVIDKLETNISAVYDFETKELVATLVNVIEGNFIKGATVQVNFNGINHVLITDSKGQVKISTADLTLGNYPASISYNGNSKYYSSKYVGIINTKFGTNVSAFYDSNSKELIVTASNLVNENGLVGATILITLDGNDYVLRTDSKGQVKVSTADLAVGMYTAYVSYNGNSKYDPSSANVIVNNRLDTNVSVVYDSGSRELVVTASNVVSGNGLVGATVLVNINGMDYVLRTDSKGQVKVSTVNLNIGDYAAAISYNGNSKYNPSSTISEFNVNKVDTNISAVYDKKSEELVSCRCYSVG